MKKKASGALVFSIVFCALLIALLITAVVYLSVSKDFIQPLTLTVDHDSYDYTLDEFAAYLNEKGILTTAEGEAIEVPGTLGAKRYGDRLVVRYDTEQEGWKTLANVGNATLEDGTWLIVYGQFGLSGYTVQETDTAKELVEAFPLSFSGNHGNKTVWEYTYAEFFEYMKEKGYFTGEPIPMSVIGTENWICDGIDIMWWDVPNLVEGTEPYDYWQSFQEDGYILFGGSVYFPQFNGPFAIYVNATCPHNENDVYAAFAAFPGK